MPKVRPRGSVAQAAKATAQPKQAPKANAKALPRRRQWWHRRQRRRGRAARTRTDGGRVDSGVDDTKWRSMGWSANDTEGAERRYDTDDGSRSANDSKWRRTNDWSGWSANDTEGAERRYDHDDRTAAWHRNVDADTARIVRHCIATKATRTPSGVRIAGAHGSYDKIAIDDLYDLSKYRGDPNYTPEAARAIHIASRIEIADSTERLRLGRVGKLDGLKRAAFGLHK